MKLKFSDFTRTTVERAGLAPSLDQFRSLLTEAFARTGKSVRLIGLGVRFASIEQDAAQMPLFALSTITDCAYEEPYPVILF